MYIIIISFILKLLNNIFYTENIYKKNHLKHLNNIFSKRLM